MVCAFSRMFYNNNPNNNELKFGKTSRIYATNRQRINKKTSERDKIIMKGTVVVKGENGNKNFRVSSKDPRFLSGELVHVNKGKVHTKEQNEAFSKSRKGTITSPETKKKLSLIMIGKNKGKKASIETKIKLSIAHKGQKVSQETIAKRIETMRKNKELKMLLSLN